MQKKVMKPSTKDMMTGVIFLLFGLLMLFVIIPLTVPVSYVPPGQISPRFLPNAICGAITFFALIITVLTYFYRKGDSSSEAAVDTDVAEPDACEPAKGETSSAFLMWAPIITMGIIVLYFFLLVWFGFIPSSVFAVLAIMLTFGERRLWVLLVTTIMVPSVVWLFAAKLLNIPMP